ncbi:AMIN-like domain-containing (lipo)protein [Nocardia sp. CA-128927]|uniref:AMIN-like domain-containing (lipo)protein n=1 Tax=Nocardia sp. CA-128927 TaxID=3239975 RepID=UPI003D97C8B3
MRNRMVLAIAAVAALLASCSDDGGSTANTPAATPSTTPSTTGTMAEATTAPRDAAAKRSTASGDAGLTVTDIRIGHQPGFDRVVYDLGGKGTPGWIVQYADRAVQDGSGKLIEVAGNSILEVQILGSAYPFDSAVTPYAGPDPATDPSVPGIAGVYRTTVFEGTTQSFIGVNADRPGFTVSTLTNPTRLVIDIATP